MSYLSPRLAESLTDSLGALQTLWSWGDADAEWSVRLLNRTDTTAAVAIQAMQPPTGTTTLTLFFYKDPDSPPQWKAIHLKGFALPGYMRTIGAILRACDEMASGDSTARERLERIYKELGPSADLPVYSRDALCDGDESDDAERYIMLVTSHENQLRAFFHENRSTFGSAVSVDSVAQSTARLQLENAGVQSVRDDGGLTAVAIGGFLENEIGFLYVPSALSPPPVALGGATEVGALLYPQTVLYLERLDSNWYLYWTSEF